MKFLKTYPIPAAGLALGILSISEFWRFFIPNHNAAHSTITIMGIISLALLMPAMIKLIRHPQELTAALHHPTIGCILPTISMSLMLISHAFNGLGVVFSSTLWLAAILLHAIFLILFIAYRTKDFTMTSIQASWYIPPVGMAVACLTTPTEALLAVSQGVAIFTMIAYVLVSPSILRTLIKNTSKKNYSDHSCAILAAPASLVLSGYLSTFNQPQSLIIILLYITCIIKTITVYKFLTQLLRLPFKPSCSCLTFPLAISAIASLKVSQWMLNLSVFAPYSHLVFLIATIEGIIASCIIFYTFIGYMKYFIRTNLDQN